MKLSAGTNDQLMAMAAHRYCLGRSTYIVGSCVEWLRDTWEQFQPNTKQVMLYDVIEALTTGRAGQGMDARDWADVSAWMWQRLTQEQRDAVANRIKHLDNPFRFLTAQEQAP